MTLIELQEQLRINRCPFCGVDKPNLSKVWEKSTTNSEGENKRLWRAYLCSRCGSIVTACAEDANRYTDGIFPYDEGHRSKDIPATPRAYLEQAIASIHAPAGEVM